MTPESEDLVEGPWEIWAGSGMALLILATDPEHSKLTRLLVRKRHWVSVTRFQAHSVFNRTLRAGTLGVHLTPPKKTDKDADHDHQEGEDDEEASGSDAQGADELA